MTDRTGIVAQVLIGGTLAFVSLALSPVEAWSQYFGRNKVQYETFDFQVMDTDHFSVHFYPEAQVGVTDGARMAERWYARFSVLLDHEFVTPKPIILYADHPDFMQTNVIDAMLGEATGGVTEGLRTRVVMPLTGIYADTDHVLGHELVHAFQFDIARGVAGAGMRSMGRLPLWFVEGMAEYLSIGRVDPHTAMWMRDAFINDRLPTVRALTRDPRFFPYRFGQAWWAYVAGAWGDDVVNRLYRSALRGGVEAAIESVLQMDPDTLSARWHDAIRSEYAPLIEGRTLPADAGQRLLAPDIDAGNVNLAPALSPDGSTVAFLSERDLFRIDLFLADAQTGRILRRVITESTDPHFDALSFVRSAGAWSPDAASLAAVVFRRGTNQIAMIDVPTGRIERHIGVEGVGALWDPAWSPDGRTLAFAGGEGGISNLYLYDLETESAQQVTTGRSAVLHPRWSPDGGTIAFVSDAGPGTDFDQLTYGPMRLALYDVATGEVQTLEIFDGAKHTNPHFSPDGQSIYFISDRGGFSDIYRIELATGAVFQVTQLATGVSGITDLSAALTVSRGTGQVMFSVFDEGNFHVYALTAEEAQGVPIEQAAPAAALGGVLPPSEAHERGQVAAYLADPLTGLAHPGDFEVRDYSPRLSLDYIGVPGLGIAVDRFGTGLAGGVAAYFGDMLGDRLLGVEAAVQGELRDAGAQVFWLNRRQRWDWIAAGARFPFIQARFLPTVPAPEIAPNAFVIQQRVDRIVSNRVVFDTRYPFDMHRRFETGIGFSHITFSRELERFLVIGRQVVDRERVPLDREDPLNLATASAAFVGDNSFFGFTSPVRGWRYRFEIQPYFGSLTFQEALADWRRYQFRMPFTLGFRGLHFGRYGRDAENPRLQPLFVGFESFIRGYSFGSFRPAQECSEAVVEDETRPSFGCPELDRLVGSSLAVANLELRIPLLGTADFGLIEFPWLPTELAPFFDIGAAWWGTDFPSLTFERDTPDPNIAVMSAGVAARFNVLGFLILETYWAYPFQRPERGGHFGIHFLQAGGW